MKQKKLVYTLEYRWNKRIFCMLVQIQENCKVGVVKIAMAFYFSRP